MSLWDTDKGNKKIVLKRNDGDNCEKYENIRITLAILLGFILGWYASHV